MKGSRRKGRIWVKGDTFYLKAPKGKKGDEIDMKIPFVRIDDLFLSRDNYYGADTVLFNLTFRDEGGKTYTARFAPVTFIPRRRIALQQRWFEFLKYAISQTKGEAK